MGAETTFADLRRLTAWLAEGRSVAQLERVAIRAGGAAVAVLGRALRGDAQQRECARAVLAQLAGTPLRPRVLAELKATVEASATDECKVSALGLLAELGERTGARFADPTGIQRRSAIALAEQLTTDADVASAADLMVRQLAATDMVAMLEIMAEATPTQAAWLCAELGARLDLDPAVRAQLMAVVPPSRPARPARSTGTSRRPSRAPAVWVLVDAAARLVVIVSRKVPHLRRWRRWAVLIDGAGLIDDCLHEDDAELGDASDLISGLVGDGYQVASTEVERARGLVAAAARRSADASDRRARLGATYYLGRDLLELGDAHLGERRSAQATSSTVGRAIELLASGHAERARALLSRCPTDDADGADVAAALAATLLTEDRFADALPHLRRAAAIEPAWPLHHWNLAAAAHGVGDLGGRHEALVRFVHASATPGALAADPAQAGRVALAERLVAAHELAARRDGLAPRRARAAAGRRRRRTERVGVTRSPAAE